MFKEESVMLIIGENEPFSIYKLDLNLDTQQEICNIFSRSVIELFSDKDQIEFDGHYKPDRDECLCISNFKIPVDIMDAIRNPMGILSFKYIADEPLKIKSIFIGKKEEDEEKEKFTIAFQNFKANQYITTQKKILSLFLTENTFIREHRFGINIYEKVHALFDNNRLKFQSFYEANQVLSLNEYYRSATDNEVKGFLEEEILHIESKDRFEADTVIRRVIARINDSNILKKYTVSEISDRAISQNIDISIENGKIVIPSDKKEIKLILKFFDESILVGYFTGDTYITNSKRKIMKN